MRKAILLLSAAALACACGSEPKSSNHENILDINSLMDSPEEDIAPLLEEVRLIPLETSEPCYMKDVVQVFLGGSRFCVSTANLGFFIFDSSGKFISRIATGSGPGQLPHYCPLAVKENPADSMLYISNFGGLIHKYAKNGDFVETIYFGGNAYGLEFLGDGVAVATMEGNIHHLKKYSPDFKEMIFDTTLNRCLTGGESLMIRKEDDNSLIYSNNECDTIFRLSGGSLTASKILDYSQRKLDFKGASAMDIFTNPEYTGKWTWMAQSFKAGRWEMLKFCEYGDSEARGYRDMHDRNFLQDTQSGKIIHLKSNELGSLAGYPFASDGEYFYSIIYPEYKQDNVEPGGLLSPYDAAKWNACQPDDNIFIVKYRLKQ